jgi:flavin reductase (DIM6/NTAB) family NADH-FMN oxidoreductase RutF
MAFKEVNIRDVDKSAVKMISDEWALVTASADGATNSMTVSWGGIGEIWGKDVVYIFIRPQRYTYELLEKTDVFSMSFFGGEYKKELTYFGRNSGRDVNKYEATGFSTVNLDSVECVEQAKGNLVCKKLAFQDIDPKGFIDESIENNYNGDYHRVYIGEIVKTYIAE